MPEGGLELYAWIFMRLSGVALLFLALGHMVLMHILNSVEVIDYDFVARRYASVLWRTYDFLMLFLAMLHGVNGARTILADVVTHPGRRFLFQSILFTVGAVFLVLGALVIFTFQPV
ncbi:MAG: succinate dehydrogenase [Elusimicrobia bacterium]|nr:succinate dehydrogenase [Elusimicrobiota bacterium]